MRPHDVTSPYYGLPLLEDQDGNQFFAQDLGPLSFSNSMEKLYVIRAIDQMRPDTVAWRGLSNVNLWWSVMRHNNVKDPFLLMSGDNLRIPLGSIVRGPTGVIANIEGSYDVNDIVYPVPPILPQPLIDDTTAIMEQPHSSVLYVFNFVCMPCVVGLIHFEIQVSNGQNFQNLIMGTVSSSNTDRWYYLNPNTGGYENWPQFGIQGPTVTGTPCYFVFWNTDPVVSGHTYYIRYRPWVTDKSVLKRGAWQGVAIVIP